MTFNALPMPLAALEFQSAPSVRRVTTVGDVRVPLPGEISIRTLREEGDQCGFHAVGHFGISIRTLREEGDRLGGLVERLMHDFNPHPP